MPTRALIQQLALTSWPPTFCIPPYDLPSILGQSYLLLDLLRVDRRAGLVLVELGLVGLRVVDRVEGLTVVRLGCTDVFCLCILRASR